MSKKFHYIGQNGLVCYSDGNTIYDAQSGSGPVKVDGILPDCLFLVKRLLRSGIHTVKMCGDVLIVVVKKRILFFKQGKLAAEIEVERGFRPLRQGVECLNGKMYYGDYWVNPERTAAHVYSVDLKTFEKKIACSFSHIQHVHCIQKDRSDDNKLIIGTGDSDSESGLYQYDVETGTMTTIAEGSQKFRAVSVIQAGAYMVWGSDAPDEDNYIYRLNRTTNELEVKCKIDGPAYYSTANKRGEMFIATTVEYRDKHRAVIYTSTDQGESWSEYKSLEKDMWDLKYFGYGIIEFVDGQENSDELYYNLVGLKEAK